MPRAYLYNNFITRNIRFSNKEAMSNRTLNYFYGEFEVIGCQITNTSSYVDIIGTDYLTDEAMFGTTYVRFNNDSNYEYMAFVDSVEPNNFNNFTEKYYRLYITVDWWSTIMWNSDITTMNRIKEKIEGSIVRAHVNDVIKKDGVFNYFLDNTTFNEEFNIDKYEVEATKLNTSKKFLYLFTSNRTAFGGTGDYLIGDRTIPQPLDLIIIPLFATKVRYSSIDENGEYEKILDIYNVSANVEAIVDSSVYSIYCTDFCYGYDKVDNIINLPQVPNVVVDGKNIVDLYPIVNINVYGGGYFYGFRVPFNIPSTKYYSNIITSKTVINKPLTFVEYLDCIAKQHFPPYTISYVSNGDNRIVINTTKCNSEILFEYNILGSVGGFLFYLYTDDLNGEYKYKALIDGNTYERLGTNDEFTQRSRISLLLNQLSKTFNIVGGIQQGIVSSVASLTGFASSSIDVYNKYKKSLRDGETGYDTQSSALNSFINPYTFNVRKPYNSELTALRYDLAKYGYNTFLHPHEILLNHKRKYFNYIKCSNTTIDMPMYNTFIRNQIEEMFDNGVWLWNTNEEFGNFEVPNYCLIMENENV